MALNNKRKTLSRATTSATSTQVAAPKTNPFIATMINSLKLLEFYSIIPAPDSKIILKEYEKELSNNKYTDPILFALNKQNLEPKNINNIDKIIMKNKGRNPYIDWRNQNKLRDEFIKKNVNLTKLVQQFGTPVFNVETNNIFTIVGLTPLSTQVAAKQIKKLWLHAFGRQPNITLAIIDPTIWAELMENQKPPTN